MKLASAFCRYLEMGAPIKRDEIVAVAAEVDSNTGRISINRR
jgi:hypothetical protein